VSDKTEQKKVIIEGIDISHARLLDLTRLADQAKPFYEWVEAMFRDCLGTQASLNDIMVAFDRKDIVAGISACYLATSESTNMPILFDGIGRSYPHQKACYYFFSWLVRDAPKQRLEPLLQRIVRASKRRRVDVEIEALGFLIYKYRSVLKTFSWDVVREIIIDRLEGSRRSIVGHERETVVRTALITAMQNYYARTSNYGIYATIEIPAAQVVIGGETYDVSARLINQHGVPERRILVPVKTRETEGGGHSHLFTRDIMSAINAARTISPDDFVIAVIVAANWSAREAETVRSKVDYIAIFDLSPNDFQIFDDEHQRGLNAFVASILDGTIDQVPTD